ncbi:ORF6C domain-containing protein [Aneurinibacillus sp. XH2]|uniref:ORF6C domain-containing protein n=1 Tax=Aneurinibacillus sp. XH2 TaxID=1450761 RepID=UPI000AA1CCAA|nr:ORF6C domain-containing protein [Aneurinibacillus sp. XH2]
MNELQIIEYKGQRALTTAQLAESYGTDSRRIQENFNANKSRYKQNKHFILLEGEELKRFKNEYGNSVVAPTANKLYLWTEKGAWLHAKSLNTDRAWEAYEMLVDEYYRVTQEKQLPQDPIELALETSLKNYQEIKALKGDVAYLKEHMRIDGAQEYALNSQGKAKVLEVLGGYESPAYNAVARKAFAELWRDFKRHFNIPRYSELPKAKFDEAVYFISKWRPSTSLEIEIESYNKQTQLKLVK